MIPVTVVRLGPAIEESVLGVIRSGMLAQGKVVAELESQFADIHGVGHAVAVNNGTTALIAAMQVLDLQPGDEVITSPFTFVATLNAILSAGATARFADIGDDYNLRADLVSEVVNEHTKVLMPVHLYGLPVDLDGFETLADEHGLAVVEDAAQAVGARYHDRTVGGAGLGCFSLYATKNIATGEGGVITTNDDDLADRLRLLRNQGMRQRYQYEMAGNNYRLTDLAAAVGVPQLARLDEYTAARQRNAAALRDGLARVPGLMLPPEPPADRSHVYHQFTVRITDESSHSRDEVVAELERLGVGSGIYYPKLVFDYDCYRGDRRVVIDDVPHAATIARQVLSLPVHPYLDPSDVDTVVAAVRKVLDA
ncbi:DegT/DnrJ/EryC1/StrS family aminotransferase [soil metagenome]